MMNDLTIRQIVADPFVQTGILAVLGVLVTRIMLRRYPARRLVFQLGFFVALTALLYQHDIVPYQVVPEGTPAFEHFFLALAKIIWWINGAWVLTAFARVFLIFESRPREGRLLQDLIVGLIYLGAVLSVVAYVFSAPLGTLIATSGVFAIILGLALQSTLGDVFSGIALNLNKPYEVGDWIVLGDGLQGRVVETNWRSTHLLNASNDLIVVPNSTLAKAHLTNLSSPNRSHGVSLRIRLAPTMAPSGISDVLNTVLLSSNAILSVPAPSIEIKSLDSQAIEFELSFRVRDFSMAAAARHEVFDLIYRHAKAAGLNLAPPKETPVVLADPRSGTTPGTRATALRMIDAVPLFSTLTEEEKQALAATMTRKTYGKGTVVAEQGAKLDSLVVIRTGVIDITRHDDEEDSDIDLGRLSPGDYFGEGGVFTGASEIGTARALTFVVAYEIGHAALATLMRDRPTIADSISVTLSRRAKIGMLPQHPEAETISSASLLVARIRQLFEVPHE